MRRQSKIYDESPCARAGATTISLKTKYEMRDAAEGATWNDKRWRSHVAWRDCNQITIELSLSLHLSSALSRSIHSSLSATRVPSNIASIRIITWREQRKEMTWIKLAKKWKCLPQEHRKHSKIHIKVSTEIKKNSLRIWWSSSISQYPRSCCCNVKFYIVIWKCVFIRNRARGYRKTISIENGEREERQELSQRQEI